MGLDIAPEKVAHVIIKAREYDAKVGAWNDNPQEGDAAEDPESILEDFASDPTRAELTGFLRVLNHDEKANLIALMWIGRGTFEAEEFEEAVDVARAEHPKNGVRYLLSTPLLANYLEDGLEKMGFSPEDIENEVM